MKQAYLDLLDKVVEEHKDKINVDESLLAQLRVGKVITKDESLSISNEITTTARLVVLFKDILPKKEDSKMEFLKDAFRKDGNEVVSNFLEEKISEISGTPGTSRSSDNMGPITETPETSLSAASGTESVPQPPKRRKRNSKSQAISSAPVSEAQTQDTSRNTENPKIEEMEELETHMKKFFFGKNFTTIKIMTSDDIFRLQDMWVKLEIKKPKGIDWSLVADYEASLTESLLENIPVIVSGEPGVGKSTLVKKICYDWAEKSKQDSTGFGKFHLILPCRLPCRDRAETIPEMVFRWLKNSLPALRPTIDTLSEKLDNLFKSYRILFVLDGWEEDLGNCEELKNLLNFPRELQYSLLITTRPRTMKRRDSRFNIYKIIGFGDEDKKIFIEKFSRLVGKKTENLVEELNVRSHLSKMARIPLLLSLLCTVEAASSAKNTAELFTIVVGFLLDRHAERGLPDDDSDSEFLEDWQNDLRIRELGKLALQGLLQEDQEHQSVFKACNLNNQILPQMVEIGLLCRENQHKLQQASYNVLFPHKTFQDFFAAVFIRSRFGFHESLSESLGTAEISGIEHWGQILKQTTAFLTGLTQVEELDNLTKMLDRNRLLSSIIWDEDNLEFDSQNPILKECKDSQTASTVCLTAVQMCSEQHERPSLKIHLIMKDFEFLSRSISDIHFHQIFADTSLARPCFSFLSNAGDSTKTQVPSSSPNDGSIHHSKLQCDELEVNFRDQEETRKLLECFRSFPVLGLSVPPAVSRVGVSLSNNLEQQAEQQKPPLDLTMIIKSCPRDVQAISLIRYSTHFDPSPSLSQEDLGSTAKEHPNLTDLGLGDLKEQHLKPILVVAAAFPALTTLRIRFSENPSTETIEDTLIPALKEFQSLQVFKVMNLGRDDDNSNQELQNRLQEDGKSISVVDYY